MKNEFSNTNSKEIWSNPLLCSQFLRDFSGVELFRQIEPGDIMDVTEQLRPFVGVEYEGDSVKQVRVHDPEGKNVYVVALLEHKSTVEFDVGFQLLKYMVGVWSLYRSQKDKVKEGSSRQKDFRYPLIIPIVYYEGRNAWTAGTCFHERVEFSGMFGQYVPNFVYRVVDLHRYSNEELLSKEEEISLVMMFNRVQTEEDLDISKWPNEMREKAERIVKKAPEAVVDLLAQMVHHFGIKLNLPDSEIIQCVKNVEDRDMGELWAHMDKIDIQEERRKTAKAREEREKAEKELAEVRKRAEEEKKRAEEEKKRAEEEKKRAEEEKKRAEEEKKQAEEEKKRAERALQEVTGRMQAEYAEWKEEKNKKLVQQVCKGLMKGKAIEEIADDLEEDEELVRDICKIAEPFAPQYDAEKILREWRR